MATVSYADYVRSHLLRYKYGRAIGSQWQRVTFLFWTIVTDMYDIILNIAMLSFETVYSAAVEIQESHFPLSR